MRGALISLVDATSLLPVGVNRKVSLEKHSLNDWESQRSFFCGTLLDD